LCYAASSPSPSVLGPVLVLRDSLSTLPHLDILFYSRSLPGIILSIFSLSIPKAQSKPAARMSRKPSSQLHLPLLALLALALIISIATLACAATTLRLFESQQNTNPWLLPIWRNHFDLRGLKLVVGTSTVTALFDLVGVVVLVVLAVRASHFAVHKRHRINPTL